MIKPAQLYNKELKEKFANIAYDLKYQFFNGDCYWDEYMPINSTWGNHEFVSIYNNEIIGYFRYRIHRGCNNVNSLQAINFLKNPTIVFSKDMHKVLTDIFDKYKFNKISFRCIIGNPIEKSYDKIIKKYGGKIVGVHEKHVKLLDGLIYDCKDYEISRTSYEVNKIKRRIK